MTKNIREMTEEEFKNIPLLDLENTLPFSCKSCGKCCKNRQDLILTPYDVFRLARYLMRETGEIIKTYCEVFEGRDSHMPVVRILPRPPENSCPFLRNRKCSVHQAKPILCRVYPIAKVHVFEQKSGYYLGDIPKCMRTDKQTTVRDWVGDAASDESNAAAAEWTKSLPRIIQPFHEKLKSFSLNERNQIFEAMFAHLYLLYDTKQDFAPQLKQNVDNLCSHLEEKFDINYSKGDVNHENN